MDKKNGKPPYPPYLMVSKAVLPGMSSEMLPKRASLRTFTAKKKGPQTSKKTINNAIPNLAASLLDGSYQYP